MCSTCEYTHTIKAVHPSLASVSTMDITIHKVSRSTDITIHKLSRSTDIIIHKVSRITDITIHKVSRSTDITIHKATNHLFCSLYNTYYVKIFEINLLSDVSLLSVRNTLIASGEEFKNIGGVRLQRLDIASRSRQEPSDIPFS
jgi:hypothetical protein